jgi:hypothetical protein
MLYATVVRCRSRNRGALYVSYYQLSCIAIVSICASPSVIASGQIKNLGI